MKRYLLGFAFVLFFVLCLAAKHYAQNRLSRYSRSEIVLPVVNAKYYAHSLENYGMGFNSLISDLIWIDLLQNASHKKIEANMVSWEYAQLEAITTLEPNFIQAYDFGAPFLSVFRQDKLGAKLILAKWVKRQPTFWRSHFTYGYHLYYEMKDYKAAYPEIFMAANLPHAPNWLTSLGIRVLSEAGAKFNALKLSLQLYDTLSSNEGKNELRRQIRSLYFAMQKTAYEEALENYRSHNHREPERLQDLVPYIGSETKTLVAALNTDDLSEDLRGILEERFSFFYDAGKRDIASVKSEKDLGLIAIGIHRNDYIPPKKKDKAQ